MFSVYFSVYPLCCLFRHWTGWDAGRMWFWCFFRVGRSFCVIASLLEGPKDILPVLYLPQGSLCICAHVHIIKM